MGALRRIRGRVRRMLCAAGAAALMGPALLALTGCEPTGDGLDAITVAVTTGKRATDELKHEGYDVRWVSCSGKAEDGGVTDKGSPRPVPAIGVDCQGRTGGGGKIIVFGRVTGISGDACVKGRVTAKVDGRTVFVVRVLGDCSRASASSGGGPQSPPAGHSVSPSCSPSGRGVSTPPPPPPTPSLLPGK
ncbi:hypothetical protein QZH56_24810 [Streptomyces olivoreticuli]|uniref:hypothetical protein n=1 Tax=Streptomyces olivoreticuli TaxID=68246 RepID=UPI00265A9D5C|nr:hypothetical protein [Streptomyces olivoreticuli]WKK22014.1 hypothetical protein QZH56_24810 [Streptomyces olivoreticuli]